MLGSPDFFQQLSSALGQELSAADLAEIEDAAIFSDFEVLHAGMASRPNRTVGTDVLRAYVDWIFQWHDAEYPLSPVHSVTHDGAHNIFVHTPQIAHRFFVHAVQPDESAFMQEIFEAASNFNSSANEYGVPSSLIFDFTTWPDARQQAALRVLGSPRMTKAFSGYGATANIFAGWVTPPGIAVVQSLTSA